VTKLSERLRPDVEAAPWVIAEVKALEAEVERLTLINGRLAAALVRQGEQYGAEVERLTADPRMALTAADLREVLMLAWGSRLSAPKGAWERVEKVRAALAAGEANERG
jgi:hypothetical protein